MDEILMQAVRSMEESVTYQMILERGEARGKAEGQAEEARRLLVLLGRSKLGEPSAEVQNALNGLSDVSRLEELHLRLNQASSWQQLLGLSAERRKKRRRPSG